MPLIYIQVLWCVFNRVSRAIKCCGDKQSIRVDEYQINVYTKAEKDHSKFKIQNSKILH